MTTNDVYTAGRVRRDRGFFIPIPTVSHTTETRPDPDRGKKNSGFSMPLVPSVNTTHPDLESSKVIPRDSMVPIPLKFGIWSQSRRDRGRLREKTRDRDSLAGP